LNVVDNKRIANHCYQAEHSMKISAALNKRIALHLFIFGVPLNCL